MFLGLVKVVTAHSKVNRLKFGSGLGRCFLDVSVLFLISQLSNTLERFTQKIMH